MKTLYFVVETLPATGPGQVPARVGRFMNSRRGHLPRAFQVAKPVAVNGCDVPLSGADRDLLAVQAAGYVAAPLGSGLVQAPRVAILEILQGGAQ